MTETEGARKDEELLQLLERANEPGANDMAAADELLAAASDEEDGAPDADDSGNKDKPAGQKRADKPEENPGEPAKAAEPVRVGEGGGAKAGEGERKKESDGGKDDDKNEAPLQSTGTAEALLLYALYRAARGLSSRNESGGFVLQDVIDSAKESFRYYTGRDLPYAQLLPRENGMRLAVDKQGRPVWADITDGKETTQKLVFEWMADGRLAVNFEDKNGFKGRIESRDKVEIAADKQSIKSADGVWLATYSDGSVRQWEGELRLKQGRSTFEWKPTFQEREHPLALAADHAEQSKRATALQTLAVEALTRSPEALRAFTVTERAQMEKLYQALMEGNSNKLHEAFSDMCKTVASPARRKALMDHFTKGTGLTESLKFVDGEKGPKLVYETRSGSVLTTLTIPWQKSEAIVAHEKGKEANKTPPAEAFLDLVRAERSARPEVVALHEAKAQDKLKEHQQRELAKEQVLVQARTKQGLSDLEKNTLVELEKSFLKSDFASFRQTLQSFDGKPAQLKKVMDEFVRDMKAYSPQFDGVYGVTSNGGKEQGIFRFGDADRVVSISTELGKPAKVMIDSRPELRRDSDAIFASLSKDVVESSATKLPPDAVPVPRTPMTGFLDATGLWYSNYLDVLPPEEKRELLEKMTKEYTLGKYENMQLFVDRIGQIMPAWQRTQPELERRVAEEKRAQEALTAARQEYDRVRDEVLKRIGLDLLPQNTTLENLQMSSTQVQNFLESEAAQKSGIKDLPAKIQTVKDFQAARSDYHHLWTQEFEARKAADLVAQEVATALQGRTLPGGLTVEQLQSDRNLLKQYLQHADATAAGITDIPDKIKALDALTSAREALEKQKKEGYDPALRKYEETRDEVLKRLGADRLSYAMSDVELKKSARMMEEFLLQHGKDLKIDKLDAKLKAVRDVQEKEEAFGKARHSVDEILKDRVKEFETTANRLAREVFKIPGFKLELSHDIPHANGDYLNGRIRYNRDYFLRGNAGDLIDTLYHEMVHAEQQYKIVSMLADRFEKANSYTPSPSELRTFMAPEVGNWSMPDEYLEDVLKTRNGKQLTADETAVAEKLLQAWKRGDTVGPDYDKSIEDFRKAQKLIEELSGRHGQRTAENLLDLVIKAKEVKSILPELPGAPYESPDGKKKSEALLEEIVRDRAAFLAGETRRWDGEKARQALIEVLRHRQTEINQFRERDWASYGGPDQKHEYDAQVTDRVIRKQAEDYFVKGEEQRALLEMVRTLEGPPELRGDLPSGVRKQNLDDVKRFLFDKQRARTIDTALGPAEITGVEARGDSIVILCRDGDGKIFSNKALAEAAQNHLQQTLSSLPDYERLSATAEGRAELLARYLQLTSERQLSELARITQVGSDKFGVVPRALQGDKITARHIESYLADRIPEQAKGREALLVRELKSLEAIGDPKLRDAIEAFKQQYREGLATRSEAFLRSLAAGEIPLTTSVKDHVAAFKASYKAQVDYFGKPGNFAETDLILRALEQSPSNRYAQMGREKERRGASNPELWNQILPRALDLEGLEQRRQDCLKELKRRGITSGDIAADTVFSLPKMEAALKRTDSEGAPRSGADPRAVSGGDRRTGAPGDGRTGAPGDGRALSPGNGWTVLPTDAQRTAVRLPGQDADLAQAQNMEQVIARAREALENGSITSHQQLEQLVAHQYLANQLEGNRFTSAESLRTGRRRALDTESGKLFTEEMQLLSRDNSYRQAAEQLLGTRNEHQVKATIEGQEVVLMTLKRTTNQLGESTIAFVPPSDPAVLKLVDARKEALFKDMRALSAQPHSDTNKSKMLTMAAELEWLSAHSSDFWAGSNDIAQAKVRALLDSVGVETGRYRAGVNPYLQALTKPLADFTRGYDGLFEKAPRYYGRDFSPGNQFARAFLDARTTVDSGKVNPDGSVFYELSQAKKVKVGPQEFTVLGVKSQDGRVAVICQNSSGRPYEEPSLTHSHLQSMDRSLNMKPIAQGAVRSDARLAANVLCRVLEGSSEAEIAERVTAFDLRKLRNSERFMMPYYFEPGMDHSEWSVTESLKKALVEGQFSDFRTIVGNLDTQNKTQAGPTDPPRTEFERVMERFKKECVLSGVDGVSYETKPDGTGVVTLSKGNTQITFDTKNPTRFITTRGGTLADVNSTYDTFIALGEEVLQGVDRAVLHMSAPEAGQEVSIKDSNWNTKHYRILANGDSLVVLRDITPPPGGQATPGGTTAAPLPAGETKNVRENELSNQRQFLEFTDPQEPGKKFILDRTNAKVYEVGQRNPLTWEVELKGRPDLLVFNRNYLDNWRARQMLEQKAETRAVRLSKGESVVLPPAMGGQQATVLGSLGDKIIVQGKSQPIYAVEAPVPPPASVSQAVATLGGSIGKDVPLQAQGFTDITREFLGQMPENTRVLIDQKDGKVYHVGVKDGKVSFVHDALSAVVDRADVVKAPGPGSRLFKPPPDPASLITPEISRIPPQPIPSGEAVDAATTRRGSADGGTSDGARPAGVRPGSAPDSKRGVYSRSQADGDGGEAGRIQEKGDAKTRQRIAAFVASEDAEGLKELARSTGDRKVAEQAVAALMKMTPDNLTDILRELSKSDSHAASSAMKELVYYSDDQKDMELVKERWNKGEILKLWKEGKVNATDMLKALDFGVGLKTTVPHLMKELDAHPELKADLCRSLLKVDVYQMSRDGFDLEQVPKSERLAAIDFLAARKDAGIEKILKPLSVHQDADVAAGAKAALDKIWTGEAQKPEVEQASSNLLLSDRLKRVSEELAKIKWPSAAEAIKEWERLQSDFSAKKKLAEGTIMMAIEKVTGNLDAQKTVQLLDQTWGNDKAMEQLLKDYPDELREYREARAAEKTMDAARAKVEELNAERARLTQKALEKVCAEIGVPVPDVRLVESFDDPLSTEERGKTRGKYSMGRGVVRVLEAFAKGEAPSAQFISTVMHEVAHLEQDTLMVRHMLDDLKAGQEIDDSVRTKLKEMYAERTGGTLTDGFIEKVVKIRDGKTLTQGEGLRAKALEESFLDFVQAHKESERLDEVIEKIGKFHRRLSSGVPLEMMLDRDPNRREESLKKLLDVKELPGKLKEALDAYNTGEKSKAADLPQLAKNLEKVLLEQTLLRRGLLERQQHRLYRERLHEVESHSVGERVHHFSRSLEETSLAGPGRAPIAIPDEVLRRASSPMTEEKIGLFIERVEKDLNTEQMLEDLQTKAKDFFKFEGSTQFQEAAKRTTIKADPTLKAGESKLVFRFGPTEFTPKSFEPAPPPGKFLLENGSKLDFDKCRFEIRVGEGTKPEAAARIALLQFNRLDQELRLQGASATPEARQLMEASLAKLSEAHERVRTGDSGGKPEIADRTAPSDKIGEFEVGGKVVEVSLTARGVRIGNKEVGTEQLVTEAIKDKQKQLDETKDEKEKERVKEELEELKKLQRDLKDGKEVELAKLQETISKNLRKEYESMKKEAGKVRAGEHVKANVGRATAYLMIVSFVAGMMISHEKADRVLGPDYAPTGAR